MDIDMLWWPAICHQFKIEFGVEMESRFGGNVANLMYSIHKLLASHAPSEVLPLCDVTQTPRRPCAMNCGTYPGNLGPCEIWEEGHNGRCVYCDHGRNCHPATAPIAFQNSEAAAQPLDANCPCGPVQFPDGLRHRFDCPTRRAELRGYEEIEHNDH